MFSVTPTTVIRRPKSFRNHFSRFYLCLFVVAVLNDFSFLFSSFFLILSRRRRHPEMKHIANEYFILSYSYMYTVLSYPNERIRKTYFYFFSFPFQFPNRGKFFTCSASSLILYIFMFSSSFSWFTSMPLYASHNLHQPYSPSRTGRIKKIVIIIENKIEFYPCIFLIRKQ